jgi:hypothetical protein
MIEKFDNLKFIYKYMGKHTSMLSPFYTWIRLAVPHILKGNASIYFAILGFHYR